MAEHRKRGDAALDGAGTHTLRTLSPAECWRLLSHTPLGRIAVTSPDGTPDVLALPYRVFGGAVYARASESAVAQVITTHPAVALEIDGTDGTFRWSVVVRGTAVRLTKGVDAATDAEIDASGAWRLESMHPGGSPVVLRLTPVSVSGRRRLAAPGRTADPVAIGSRRVAEPDRASRPIPIPHFPPPT